MSRRTDSATAPPSVAQMMASDSTTGTSTTVIGRAKQLRERYYAISGERRLAHPGVLAIQQAARRLLSA